MTETSRNYACDTVIVVDTIISIRLAFLYREHLSLSGIYVIAISKKSLKREVVFVGQRDANK